MIDKRNLTSLLLAAAAFLAGTAAAHARTVDAGRLLGGPVLAGKRVAWTALSPHRVTVRAQSGRSAPVVVRRYRRKRGLVPDGRLAASPTTIALEVISFHQSERGNNDFLVRDVFAGPPDGSWTTLATGCQPLGSISPRTIDVSGTRVFYVDCGSRGVIRDAATGATEQLPASDRGLRLAGRYAAWLEGDPDHESVVVYDRSARSVAYAVPDAATPGGVQDLDLQSDGTLALAYEVDTPVGRTIRNRVAWASVDQPELHVATVGKTNPYHVKIAANRIAYDGGPEFAGILTPTTVGVVDIATGRRHVVATGGEGITGDDHLDFDGRRVAWYSYGCRHAIVHVTSADSLTRAGRRNCRLRFTRPPRVRRRHVQLRLDCFGFSSGACWARRVRVLRGRAVVARGRVPEGVKLTPRGRRLLRRHRGALRVRIVATVMDGSGRHERRRTTALLRR
jgi:hypothetical protein